MSDLDEVKRQLRQLVAENFLADSSIIRDDDSLMEAGVIDSAGVLTLILLLEEHFSVQVADDEVTPENLDSLKNLARFIAAKQVSADIQ
jgi:acyl carrier protein